MASATCLPGNAMRCNLSCKFLLLFILISVIALSSSFLLRELIMRDFARYTDGESQDRIQRVIALLEGAYERHDGWNKETLATDLAWALQLGVDVRLFDMAEEPGIGTEQAVSALPPLLRKRIREATGYAPHHLTSGFVPYPLYLRGEEIGYLEARLFEQVKEDYFVRSSNRVLLMSVTVLGLVSVIAGLVASRSLVWPILELADASKDIATGTLSRRVTTKGHDEIGSLSRSFNVMAERLEAQERLRRTLLTNAAHELRTPLAIISGELEGMIDGVLPTNAPALQSLHDETRRLTAILDGVDELARAEASTLSLNLEFFPLKPYLTTIAARLENNFTGKQAVLLVECPDELVAYADPDRLSQIIINLVSNGLRYISIGGRVVLLASKETDRLVLEVRDNGSGIAEDDLPYIFERFYKGKGGGLGLGLAIVQELVSAHGGSISVRSAPQSGASFRITLPQPDT